jgi:adenylate cyclase
MHYFEEVNRNGLGVSTANAAQALLLCRRIIHFDLPSTDEDLDLASKYAQKAVSLDENDSFAHGALSRVYCIQRYYAGSVEEAETAVELNPSSSFALFMLGIAPADCGRPADAIPILERSIKLSPKGPFLKGKKLVLAFCHYALGNFDEAVSDALHLLQGPGVGPYGYTMLAAAQVRLGQLAEARASIEQAVAESPGYSISGFMECWQGVPPRLFEPLVDDLRTAGLPE